MLMPALIVGIVIMIRVVVSWEVVEGFWNIFPDKEERALEDIDRWGEQKHDLLIAALTREDYLYGNACFALALLPEFDSPELRDKLVQALNEQKGDRDYLSIALCILGDEIGRASCRERV